MLRAAIEKNRGNTAEAIQLLESVRATTVVSLPGVGNHVHAWKLISCSSAWVMKRAAEFKKIIDSPGHGSFFSCARALRTSALHAPRS